MLICSFTCRSSVSFSTYCASVQYRIFKIQEETGDVESKTCLSDFSVAIAFSIGLLGSGSSLSVEEFFTERVSKNDETSQLIEEGDVFVDLDVGFLFMFSVTSANDYNVRTLGL